MHAALGLPSTQPVSWIRLHDTLAAMRAVEGLPLPAGASAAVLKTIFKQVHVGHMVTTLSDAWVSWDEHFHQEGPPSGG